MYKNRSYQQTLMLNYLNKYLSKQVLKMKFVMKNIKHRIETNQPITIGQFNSIIKFIERETEFETFDRTEIFSFFEPIIEKHKQKVTQNGNDLSEFFI